MPIRTVLLLATFVATMPASAQVAAPLTIGETFTLESRTLGETRRINVYVPPLYGDSGAARPVMYMPDGGIGEDFLHVAGLMQVSVMNGTMRPFILVGIENTERRRDMTGPTTVESDRAIAPRVGGSAAFRTFIRDELMPQIRSRYPTTDEAAIVGESLAGLFVVETFLLEPTMFDTFIAIDPSLWWNGGLLVEDAATHVGARPLGVAPRLFLASSSETGIAEPTARLAALLRAGDVPSIHHPMPAETHGSIYHPAALYAFRALFGPDAN